MFEPSGAARLRALRAVVVAVALAAGCGDDAAIVEHDLGPPTQFGDDDDAGRDASARDSGPREPGAHDAGSRDAGPRDAGPPDAGPQTPDAFAICPEVSGLGAAAGGTFDDAGAAALILTNDADGTAADDTLEVTEDGKHCFTKTVAGGGKYRVAIKDDPTFPFQTCTVSGASGTVVAGDITSVSVDCAVDRFTVGGSVSGLDGTLVLSLRDDGGAELDEITLNATGSYASTSLASGQRYQMVVKTQPMSPVQTCAVQHATGQLAGADVTHVDVTCSTNTFTVSGTILNHGGSMTLQNEGGNDLVVPAGATTFMFTAPVASGDDYDVDVSVPPTNGACMVTNDTGTITNADVSNVQIECTIIDVFTLTGAMQTFMVPPGVTSVDLEVYGGQGAPGGHFPIPDPPAPPPAQTGGPGGLGAKATGTLAVTPGQTLYLFVGGDGVSATAGFNGGGAGGVGDIGDPLGVGGGGGGASDVRVGGTTFGARVITAAGGGGGGGAGSGGSCEIALQGGLGGPGGGGNGGNGENASGAGGGGLGATGANAGTAGVGCATFLGNGGAAGTTGIGGDGGNGQACCCAMDPSGGGGGGGFVGGGGGGGASAGSVTCFGSGKGGGGGGAGGTSDVSGVSAGTTMAGVHAGAGEIRVTY